MCIFAASEIPLLGCIVGKHGVRHDPEKIKAMTDGPVPVEVKGLRQFLGLADYLYTYSRNYADMTVHLYHLLKTKNGHGALIVSVPLKVSRRS